MKIINLSRGKFAIVDDDDYKNIVKWNWFAVKSGNRFYAVRNKYLGKGKVKSSSMHREILGLKKGEIGDHIDGDGLNNQRGNLRKCTSHENSMNRSASCNRKFKGVYMQRGLWRAKIRHKYQLISLGYFNTENEAALAYNVAALELRGVFAKLNVV